MSRRRTSIPCRRSWMSGDVSIFVVEVPNGIPSFSQGLERSDYSGSSSKKIINRNAVASPSSQFYSTPSELIDLRFVTQRSRISSVNAGLIDKIPSGYSEIFSVFAAFAFCLLRFPSIAKTQSWQTQLFFKNLQSCNSLSPERIGGALAGVPKASRFAMARIKALALAR